MNKVTLEDFAESFGTTTDTFSSGLVDMIQTLDFSYEQLEGKKRDDVILDVLKFTQKDKQIIAGEGRKEVWHKGWGENLEAFRSNGGDESAIVPKFIRPGMAIRYKQEFIMPQNSQFELDYVKVFRTWFYQNYFADFDNVYEFGAGTGFNLTALASVFPDKKYYGSDFVQTSVDLINELPNKYDISVEGFLFDMISPDLSRKIEKNSAIFTFGAMEQLASQFENFLQYLLNEKPELCLHVEPTVELYDEGNLIDHLASSFHKKRGYTQGYLPRLRELEEQGKVEIQKVKRLFFGSINFEGYTLIVWKPKK